MMGHSVWDIILPPKYDFYGMLMEQAEYSARGVERLEIWMHDQSGDNYDRFVQILEQADQARMGLEAKLVEAFATPFDREDIYTFSVRMGRILKYGQSALLAIREYDVAVDDAMLAMTDSLNVGMRELARMTALLAEDPRQAEEGVAKMRQIYSEVQSAYRKALADLFKGSDAMETIKRREVYYEIKAASEYLDMVVDVVHRIIVRLV